MWQLVGNSVEPKDFFFNYLAMCPNLIGLKKWVGYLKVNIGTISKP